MGCTRCADGFHIEYKKGIGGIFPDPEDPGFKKVILRPNFISLLDHFEASHDGPYGKIISKWERTGGNLVYMVTVPRNSSAVLYLLSESNRELDKITKTDGVKSTEQSELFTKIQLESGNYIFKIH